MFVRKGSDTTRSATTTLTDDPDLVIPAEANKTYDVEVRLLLTSGSGTPDWKFGWSLPAGATIYWGPGQYSSAGKWDGVSIASGPTAIFQGSDVATFGSTGSAIVYGLRLKATLVIAGTAGDVALQWAQNTSDGSNNTVKENSFIRYTEVP